MINKNDINLYAIRQTWANGRIDYILGYYTRKSEDEFFRGYAQGAPQGSRDFTNEAGMRFELISLDDYCKVYKITREDAWDMAIPDMNDNELLEWIEVNGPFKGKKEKYVVSYARVNDCGDLYVEGVGTYEDKESAVKMMNERFDEALKNGGYEYEESYDDIVRSDTFCEACATDKMYIQKVVIDVI